MIIYARERGREWGLGFVQVSIKNYVDHSSSLENTKKVWKVTKNFQMIVQC